VHRGGKSICDGYSSVATAAQWQKGGPSLAQAERGNRAGDSLPSKASRTARRCRDLRVVGPPSTQPPATPAFLGGHRPHSRKPKFGDANGVARSKSSFPPKRKPFRTTQTEVITTIQTSPRRARWSASDRSPQGEPTLPAARHIQVEREWCPAILAAQADPDGYGLRMVRNTHRKGETPCAT